MAAGSAVMAAHAPAQSAVTAAAAAAATMPTPAPTPRSIISNGSPHPSTPRRPSPWHEIAALVSSPSVPLPRRGSAPALAPQQQLHTPSPPLGSPATVAAGPTPPTPIPHAASTPPIPSSAAALPACVATPYDSDDSAPASVTSSQALRDWERLLAAPDNDVTRHALIPLSSSAEGSPQLGPAAATALLPKLAAERDKEGHIEYKLKLIEPSAERFERLVTQMMWRLKQGRNEAIYELGLADDGTVIGLTRAEMDASLATLERMASEVGATVLVLKEIVLAAGDGAETARRPDLDAQGQPRKGSRGLNGSGADTRSRRERLRARRDAEAAAAAAAGLSFDPPFPRPSARAIIFDQSAGSDSDEAAAGDADADADVDDDGAQFALDMEDADAPVAVGNPRLTSRDVPSPSPSTASSTAAPSASTSTSTADADAEARAEAKRRKSAARREARRLDLLRGDGTACLPYAERSRSPVAEFIGHAPAIATHMRHMLPHQPARPSSLRLGAVPRKDGGDAAATATHDDSFVDGLALPLDSLSLSFADVHSASTSPTQSSVLGGLAVGVLSGGTAAAAATHTLAPLDTSPPGEELICVEALVVRKPHGDEWEYGGHDDGWGFGAPAGDDDDEGAGEVREDDPWGFDDDDE